MDRNYKGLAESEAFRELIRLGRRPCDLTSPGVLQDEQRWKQFSCSLEEWRLFYATERVDVEVIAGLQALADELELVTQFRSMRRGAVLNRIKGFPSEHRQVLHTACRDVFAPLPAAPEATEEARQELEKLRAFLADLDNGTVVNAQGQAFDTMVHIGIGGSDLGPRAMFEAMRGFALPERKVHFIANVDPDDAARVLAEVNLATTLITIVSKSGSTLETLTNETLARNALQRAGLDPAKHCLAVTGKGSPMDDSRNYLRSFYIFDYIGGRYSVTSMVGAVVLGFALGFSAVLEFLEGAAAVDSQAEQTQICDNLPLLLALLGIWNHNILGHSTLAILPYSQALHRFTAHLQQCDMESNGKSVDRHGRPVSVKTGPVIWGEPGTNGQHAFYQLLHQGTEVVPAEFIGFRWSQRRSDELVEGTTSQQKLLANLFAQCIALAVGRPSDNPNKAFPGNRPSCLLLAEKATARTLGALLAIYEAKIVFQGFAWNVNSFDQEGVQLGKVLAGGFLEALRQPDKADDVFKNIFLKQIIR
jgi:glucose-6-phosphate isomerase